MIVGYILRHAMGDKVNPLLRVRRNSGLRSTEEYGAEPAPAADLDDDFLKHLFELFDI
jgi:hypothetical protein